MGEFKMLLYLMKVINKLFSDLNIKQQCPWQKRKKKLIKHTTYFYKLNNLFLKIVKYIIILSFKKK